MSSSTLELPSGYYLERDPDILILRRLDGTMVAAFSAYGATVEAIQQTAEEAAYGELCANGDGVPTPDTPSVETRLWVRFFGNFEIFRDDEVLPLGTNAKALTILKYLLAHRTRPVSRDHLMGLLWPESNLKRARWSLNSAVRSLRKLLGDRPSTATFTNCILLEDSHYRLSPTLRVSTDVDEFDAHYEQARRLEKDRRPLEATEEYEKAVGLYRDDYLVEDLYEDWTMVERERLANAYMDTLDRLADHYMDAGRWQDSVRARYRILEKDPCHEVSYRLLMECYVRLGLRTRALRQYRLCEGILKRKRGMVPSPETRALYRSILRNDVG